MLAESAVVELLKHAHLFKEAVQDKQWTYSFPKPDSATGLTTISYNSKQSDAHTLFFCKGRNFKRAYHTRSRVGGAGNCYGERFF